MNRTRSLALVVMCALTFSTHAQAQWQAQKAPLMTRWAKDVTAEKAHPEYPRPQMVREKWQNLNGLWDYAIVAKDEPRPEKWEGKILVPFPVESALSGVMKRVGGANRLWYRRTFEVPAEWQDQRVLLHFGAVDWDTTVWVNGKEVGKHVGGYDPFSFDITDALKRGEANEIVLGVWDPTTEGYQPIGKQHAQPRGIWYTPTTGIWQTAWLEPVPKAYIQGLKITPDVDNSSVRVTVNVANAGPAHVVAFAVAHEGQLLTATGEANKEIVLKLNNPKLWSPDSPFLYSMAVSLADANGQIDKAQSYFGMRKVSVEKDKDGITRLMLNGKFLFQIGFLDQGFWPDGLYTAPTHEAMVYDLEISRKLGMNMVRKHVKVEPATWYHACDKMGLLVWQDMPSGEKHVRSGQGEIVRNETSAKNFERELKGLIDAHYNYPSIVMWVPFNEGWGQYDTVRITNWVKQYDPSRWVNCASGWNDYPVGDVIDMHNYPGPGSPKPTDQRAAVLGEFGGLGLPLEGHTWQSRGNWGYRSFTDKESLQSAYLSLISRLRPLIGNPGLSAAVYTQTTDVEIEVNGLLTYDREVIKVDVEKIAAAHATLHLPPPKVSLLAPTAQSEKVTWKYTTDSPANNWFAADFDDSAWQSAPGGFGTEGTPGAKIGTEWKSSQIWVRRTFDLAKAPSGEAHLLIHHDEDAEVYINGVPAATLTGHTTDYQSFPLTEKARAALKAGKNTIAIHCKQTRGGQYIDAGLVEVTEEK